MLPRTLDGFPSVGAPQHTIAAPLQVLPDEAANTFFIFGKQNRLRSRGHGNRGKDGGRVGLRLDGRRLDRRKQNSELGAAPEFARYRNRSAALLDDPVNGGKPESGAFPLLLGGEERVKDVSFHFGRNPSPGVTHRKGRILARSQIEMRLGKTLVDDLVGRLDYQFPPFGMASRALSTRFMITCSI